MALTDTPWSGSAGDKLYLQSGSFTSTLKTSQSVTTIDTTPRDISWDGTNTPWCGSQASKLYLTSGQFTSTLKDSEAAGVDVPVGISWDGTNTPWCGISADKLYLQSGQFTSTLKTSEVAGAGSTDPNGISYDGVNTPWAGDVSNKLYVQSGQFTSTVKTSEDITSINGTPTGISYDGTNTFWIGDGPDKLYLTSGQFTSTIKDSESVGGVDSVATGIETNDVVSRLAGVSSSGDVAITLPLSVSVLPGPMAVFTLPSLTIFAGHLGSRLQLPIFTVSATGNPDPFAVLGTFAETLPVFTVETQSGFGNHVAITLPLPTVLAYENVRGNISVTLPRPIFQTVVQQGSVENIDLTLPLLTLSAFSGHPVGLTLPQFAVDIVGQSGFVGTYNKNLPRMIVNVKATQKPLVTANIILPQVTLDNSVLTGEISTSGNRVFPALTLNAHAFRGDNGNVAITLPVLTLASEDASGPDGTFSQSLKMLTLNAYGDSYTNRII